MRAVEDLVITRTINGVPTALYAGGPVQIDVKSRLSGQYDPGCVDGPPECCYPAEYPEIELTSVRTRAAVGFHDDAGALLYILPAGTEVGPDLSDAQATEIENEELSAALEYGER